VPLKLKRFLTDLNAILEQDFPLQLQEIRRTAQGITCLQLLDNERAVIEVLPETIRIASRAPSKKINVKVVLSRDCLFKLLDGKLSLEEAFNRQEFEVYGEPELLLKCYRIWESVLSLSRNSPRFYFLVVQLR
jgi:hypothetical protein